MDSPAGVASDDDALIDELPIDSKYEELADGIGYGADDGPESQGASAGRAFGADAQGTFGDEDYDLSYGPRGLAGPQEVDESERGADTPEVLDWDATAGDAADVVANEEREVATGDLAALEEVRKKTAWADDGPGSTRPDDRVREDIQELLVELGEGEIQVEVADGEVLLLGAVATDERRDRIDEQVQGVEGVVAIDNRIFVGEDEP
jgi:hypothetical protein